MKTKIIIFYILSGILSIIIIASMWTIKQQQDLLNLNSKEIKKLENTNLDLEGKLKIATTPVPVDLYGYKYTSSSYTTETFDDYTDDNCSYWFIYYINQPNDGIQTSDFIKQDTPYFSYEEFKKPKDSDKKVITGRFIMSLTKVSRETYEANKESYK